MVSFLAYLALQGASPENGSEAFDYMDIYDSCIMQDYEIGDLEQGTNIFISRREAHTPLQREHRRGRNEAGTDSTPLEPIFIRRR